MSVIYINSSKDLDKIVPNTNLVLGLFDGVHIGHYQLISASRYM
ncbi:MAG TPA: bifunctional riboflavin kinase/FAD synthetase, partial [Firmicutes bacterium]|nr:bifunctional riboflavin kinase/FAD synthetase [Bacillota bacterium]